MSTTTPTTTVESHEAETGPITSANDTLTVIPWHDTDVEHTPGTVKTDSDDALVWYTPSIGTIGMAMAHRFARHATDGPSCWTVEDIARTFGLGASTTRVLRVVERLERFDVVAHHGHVIAVRLWLPPLTHRQRSGLPGYLAHFYDAG